MDLLRYQNFDETGWLEEQTERYGPVVGGEALRSLLGFRTAAAFQKARLQGQVGVAVFGIPGRQGVFAVTQEACGWLLAQRHAAARGSFGPGRAEGGDPM
jgi:hypothetical protein